MKLANQVSNGTQSVEGIEVTNAIIAAEITMALKGSISSSAKSNLSAQQVASSVCSVGDRIYFVC